MKWRFNQYVSCEKLIPYSGFNNKNILDHGCALGIDAVFELTKKLDN